MAPKIENPALLTIAYKDLRRDPDPVSALLQTILNADLKTLETACSTLTQYRLNPVAEIIRKSFTDDKLSTQDLLRLYATIDAAGQNYKVDYLRQIRQLQINSAVKQRKRLYKKEASTNTATDQKENGDPLNSKSQKRVFKVEDGDTVNNKKIKKENTFRTFSDESSISDIHSDTANFSNAPSSPKPAAKQTLLTSEDYEVAGLLMQLSTAPTPNLPRGLLVPD